MFNFRCSFYVNFCFFRIQFFSFRLLFGSLDLYMCEVMLSTKLKRAIQYLNNVVFFSFFHFFYGKAYGFFLVYLLKRERMKIRVSNRRPPKLHQPTQSPHPPHSHKCIEAWKIIFTFIFAKILRSFQHNYTNNKIREQKRM